MISFRADIHTKFRFHSLTNEQHCTHIYIETLYC